MICRHPWLALNLKIITTRQALNLKILYVHFVWTLSLSLSLSHIQKKLQKSRYKLSLLFFLLIKGKDTIHKTTKENINKPLAIHKFIITFQE